VRLFFITVLFFLGFASVTAAQEVRLQSLESGDDAGPWQAVGRLDVGGQGFCTGALIAPQLVITAAHCLFNKMTGERINHEEIEFLAGWRRGRASAYRMVRRAVLHPDFFFDGNVSSERVRNDLALLELDRPIRNTTIVAFDTGARPLTGDRVGIVSYAHDRAEAPSLQEVCRVLARQEGVLVTSCKVDFGSSGAPIFVFSEGQAQIVSVVSAKAIVNGQHVSLGTALTEPLAFLQSELASGRGVFQAPGPQDQRVQVGGVRRDTGAKFVKPMD
jgi:protease YdgD